MQEENKVVSLHKPVINKKLIQALEELLQEAKEGELQGLIYVGISNEDHFSKGMIIHSQMCLYALMGLTGSLVRDLEEIALRDK